MQRIIYIAVMVIASLILLSSCETKKGSLPASSGKTAEILFVCDNNYWVSLIGDSIKQIFQAEYQILNQPEPLFSIAQIEEKSFSKIFQSHRNIIIINIKTNYEKQTFELRKNVWAQPQMVFTLSAKNQAEFLELLSKQKENIIAYIYENERERMTRSFKREENVKLSNDLKESFGFSLIIPKGYFIAKKTKDFCWIRRETDETSMGILYYTYPYSDTNSFDISHIINLRDSITQEHIPGPREGSFMQVSQKVVIPISKKTSFKNKYTVETRGLWEVKKDFMGGPFINYTFVDEEKNMVITLDGFVYAPRFEKRDYVIQLESIIYSFNE